MEASFVETENIVVPPPGEPAREQLSPGSYVRLSVADTGSGMPPEVLARAFEPFFTTKEPALVGVLQRLWLREAVGDIRRSTVTSGVGTHVNILCRTEGSDQVGPASIETPEGVTGGGETILVVEDNLGVRRLTVELLKMLGYRVLEAGDARSALETLHAGEPVHLVFSDVIMPGGVSGVELARKIKELWPSQKILLTSGFAGMVGETDRDAVLESPMLRKPYSQIELGRAIRAALAARQNVNDHE